MTPEEMGAAIATVMKWPQMQNGVFWVSYPDRPGSGHESDIVNDLNAMHEARKTLTFPQQDRMDHELENIGIREGNPFPLSSSSAAQQAEAFCRTLFPERFK